MDKDHLNKLWEIQANDIPNLEPEAIISKAKKQRHRQYTNIIIMLLTVVVLVIYAFYYAFNQWNSFNLGLMLMVSSLTLRILLEFYSLHRKEKQLISMTQKSYHAYLKKYYKTRLIINYVVTPICIAVYIFGFYLLLPYFEQYLSKSFYTYILVSGIVSLLFVITIIIFSIRKEQRFLKYLNKR